jgi:hypothetical protein
MKQTGSVQRQEAILMIDVERALNRMRAAGYSEIELTKGVAYAESVGYDSLEAFFSAVMTRILFRPEEIADGARFPVEPGSLG